MHQSVLVHADVHEGPEGGDVGDRALEYHVRAQVREFLHAVLELRHLEFRTRVAARLRQLRENVPHRGQADLLIGVVGRVQ